MEEGCVWGQHYRLTVSVGEVGVRSLSMLVGNWCEGVMEYK